MKKLLIVAAVALTAALTQAATVSWSVAGLLDSKGNSMSSGAGYVFTTKGPNATSVAAVTEALAALTSADALKTYLADNSLLALKGTVSGGEISVSGVDLLASGIPEKTTGTKIFAVIVDDDTFGDDVKYVVTTTSGNVKTPDSTTTSVATFGVSNSATLNPSTWTAAAPEPTSGLLPLLGVAGLALKRKRA